MKNWPKISVLIIILAIAATQLSGCASIPIPSSIPIPNPFVLLGL